MFEITWRYDPQAAAVDNEPDTAAEALEVLRTGSRSFAALGHRGAPTGSYVIPVDAVDLGFGAEPGHAPSQEPFAAILGCSDARAPLELVLSQSANDLFVVRVAGNVLGSECVGSLDYAVAHLSSVRLLAVVGHTACGAVGAAVDAYLAPAGYLGVSGNLPLRRIVDALMATVRGADIALRAVHGDGATVLPGYRAALVDAAVVLNAAVAADAVRQQFADQLGEGLGIGFGVYDLASRTVGQPQPVGAEHAWTAGLAEPPAPEAFPVFASRVASSAHVADLLAGPPPAAH